MKLNFGFPLVNKLPNGGYQEIPRTEIAAGQSNAVLATFSLPQPGALLRVLLYAVDTVAKTIGVYEMSAVARNNADRVAKATGTLTSTGTFGNGETVTIGSKVYTFQTTLTNVDGNVLIGSNAAESHANLKAAINLAGGAGVTYAAAMTAHPTVVALTGSSTTTVVQAISAGTAGNSIASTKTVTNASWGAATLAGGVDAWALVGSVDQVAYEEDSGWAATVTINATTGVFEVKVTSDDANITAYSGAAVVTPLD